MKRARLFTRGAFVLGACLALASAAGTAAAQQKEEPARPEKEWKPAFVPADALKFGATLEEKAPAQFKGWCHGHVTKHMRKEPVKPRAAMDAVDEHYPRAPEISRDAGAFLLQYLAYKDEDTNQLTLAGRIREIDRTTYDLSREINIMAENEQRRLMPTNPRAAIGAEARVRMDAEIRQREEKIRQLAMERQMRATELEASRKKVNLYLKALGLVFERMKDVPADSIAELK
jgi:hypothetical protein